MQEDNARNLSPYAHCARADAQGFRGDVEVEVMGSVHRL